MFLVILMAAYIPLGITTYTLLPLIDAWVGVGCARSSVPDEFDVDVQRGFDVMVFGILWWIGWVIAFFYAIGKMRRALECRVVKIAENHTKKRIAVENEQKAIEQEEIEAQKEVDRILSKDGT